ncbi:MAG TPA: hypothetical protein VG146_21550 [Verrucomicrobiae bacterium]|nr:hypothetical protein [Verrucomicrobiae bacterium]
MPKCSAAGTVTFDYSISGSSQGSFGWFNVGSIKPTGYYVPYGQLQGYATDLVTNFTSASFSVAAGDYFGFQISIPPFAPPPNQRVATIQNAVMSTNAPVVNMSYLLSGKSLVLSWSQGVLQSSGDAMGTYTDITAATSPYTIPLTGSKQFYRVRIR